MPPATAIAPHAELPQGDDLNTIRRRYLGKPLWAVGSIAPRTADRNTGVQSIRAGTRLVLRRVERAAPSEILLAGTYAPEIEEVRAKHPVTLVFARRRFAEWGASAVFRIDVLDLAHVEHLFSATPPPRWLGNGGGSEPPVGGTPDEAAWAWGWPPVRRTKAEMRRMREWKWGPAFHSRSVFFENERVVGVTDFPSLP